MGGSSEFGERAASGPPSPLPLPLELFPAKGSTRAFLSPGRECCSRGAETRVSPGSVQPCPGSGSHGGCSPAEPCLSIPAEMLSSSPRASAHFPPCRASHFTPGTCEVARGSRTGGQTGPRGGLQPPTLLRWDTAAPCCAKCPGRGGVLESL